jgi:hypothetical protein
MAGTDADRRQLAEEGLREAHSRLNARLSGQESGDPLISLGEFLSWLFALRDHHRGKHKLISQKKAWSASVDEQTFYALVFARNQIQHDLERTGELVETLIPAGPIQAVHSQSRVVGMVPAPRRGGYTSAAPSSSETRPIGFPGNAPAGAGQGGR